MALSTTNLLPNTKAAKPITTNIKDLNIPNGAFSLNSVCVLDIDIK